MRKYYIDNLRWLTVLLLFPYHIFRIYDSFVGFYIKGDSVAALTNFLQICSPWFMPILFVIAGMSTFYALQKRTPKKYINERITKLLIPFVSGLLLLVPMQSFFAEKFHNGYLGSYFHQYTLFFTKFSDLSGYSGGFTLGQMWFILALFLISLVALPIVLLYRQSNRKLHLEKLSIFKILSMFSIVFVMSFILDIEGKSLGEYFALFMLGYFVLSDDNVQERLDKNRWYLICAAIIFTAANVIYRNVTASDGGIIYDILIKLLSWISILGIIGMGKHYLNFRNKFTDYFANASFPIYIFHQSWIILVAYYVFLLTSNVALQIILILIGSFVLTILTYELCKRTAITRFLFGIKNR